MGSGKHDNEYGRYVSAAMAALVRIATLNHIALEENVLLYSELAWLQAIWDHCPQ